MSRRFVPLLAVYLALALGLPLRGQAPPTMAPRTDRYGDPLPPGAVARLGTVRFRGKGASLDFRLSPDGKMLAHTDGSQILLCDRRTGAVRHRLRGKEDETLSLINFSPDGYLLATVTTVDHCDHITVWQVATGKKLWRLPTTEHQDLSGTFTADGKTFLSWGVTSEVRVWESASGKLLRNVRLPRKPEWGTIDVSPDGTILAAVVDPRTIRLWDLRTSKVIRTLPALDQPVDWLRLSPRGRVLAAVDDDKRTIRLWEVGTGKLVVIRTREEIYPVPLRFSADGRTVATPNSRSTTFYAWDTATGKALWNIKGEIATAWGPYAFSPTSRFFAIVGHDGLLQLRDVRKGKLIRRFTGRLASYRSSDWPVAFSADGRVLAASNDRALRFWDVLTGKPIETARGHTEQIWRFRFSADGHRMVTTENGLIYVWDVPTGRLLQTFQGHEENRVDGLALSPDGRIAASCGYYDTSVRVWDTGTGRERYQFPQRPVLTGPAYFGIALAFCPDGKSLAVSSLMSTRVEIRDTITGRRRGAVELEGYVERFGFSSDAKVLAVEYADPDNRVALFDAATLGPTRIPQLPTEGLAAFSCDGKLLACVKEGKVEVWEVATGKRVYRFRRPHVLVKVTFTPMGRLLALEADPGRSEHAVDGPWDSLGLWDADSGKMLHRFEVPATSITLATFSPRGDLLATAMEDTSVLIWDLRQFALSGLPRETKLDARQLDHLWDDLAGEAARAYRAVRTLRTAPDVAVPFLGRVLKPAVEERFPRLITNLDAKDFPTRQAAARELVKLGWPAEPALRVTLHGRPSLEVRRRVEGILKPLTRRPLPPDFLRQMRAVQVLEQVGTPAAMVVLKRLAGGAAEARLTEDAKAALRRLELLSVLKP